MHLLNNYRRSLKMYNQNNWIEAIHKINQMYPLEHWVEHAKVQDSGKCTSCGKTIHKHIYNLEAISEYSWEHIWGVCTACGVRFRFFVLFDNVNSTVYVRNIIVAGKFIN